MHEASLSELRLDQGRKTPSRWSLYFFNGLLRVGGVSEDRLEAAWAMATVDTAGRGTVSQGVRGEIL